MLEMTNKVLSGYDSLEDAFPVVDPGVTPLGSRVLCQIRLAKTKTKGGIILTQEAVETDQWNTQIAKVVTCGQLAFRNRTTAEKWPEGDWVAPGDFVRVPKYGGDKWTVNIERDGEQAEIIFVIFNDLDLIGKVSGDPLAMRAFF